ncbi:MAG: Lrp/AsnC family transcriptional regulator [Pyrobaculum sp.]
MVLLLERDDRVLISMILADADVRITRLAKELGMSKQAVAYRLKRLKELGVLGEKMVYVRPDVVGTNYVFFETDADPGVDAVLKFATLEGTYIFAVEYRDGAELAELKKRYGRPWLVPGLRPREVGRLKLEALKIFIKNPSVSSVELAQRLGVPPAAGRKLRRWVLSNVNVVYRVDVAKSGVVALAVRSKAVASLRGRKFFRCFARAAGFYALAFPDLASAYEAVSFLKARDSSTTVSVIMDYQFSLPRRLRL